MAGFVLRAPKFETLEWTNPLAAGFLYCDNHMCGERGGWTSWPYLIRDRTLRQAARAWYLDRIARMKREEIRFFEGAAVVNPLPENPTVEPLKAEPEPEPEPPVKKAKKAAKKKRKR